MIMTVQDLLTDALGLINTTAADETPSTSDLNVAMRAANVMIDRWSSQQLMLRSTDEITFTCIAGQAEYTIGPSGADITKPKPLSVQHGFLTDSDIDYPLDVISRELYDSYQDKNVSQSRPDAIAYDPMDAQQTVPQGTFYLYYTPDKAYPVTLQVFSYLTEFVNLSDNVNFEPAYYEALIYNIAVRVFRRFHAATVVIPPDIEKIAHESLSNIKALNSTRILAGCDLPGARVTVYNVYTDGY